MAEHADTTGQLDDAPPGAAARARAPSWARALIAAGLVLAAVAGLGGWLGYRSYRIHQAQTQRTLFVQLARQAAVNLTTISHTDVDADVQRILDAATGSFRDDFQQRAQPFIDTVKQAQSTSQGTVTEAALESATDERAQVLVAVSVHTSVGAAPEQDPRHWRMRISVQKVGEGAKVSNVVFVP